MAQDEILRRDTFYKGRAIFREDEDGDAAYVIDSGRVGIFKIVEGEEIRLATLSAGELFGEMAIIDGSSRMATAVALENSVLVTIPRDTMNAKMAKCDPFLKALVKILVRNLRNVHKAYMLRPRSVHDHLAAITYHAENFRKYMENPEIGNDAKKAVEYLDKVDEGLASLRQLFENYEDVRFSVISADDLRR